MGNFKWFTYLLRDHNIVCVIWMKCFLLQMMQRQLSGSVAAIHWCPIFQVSSSENPKPRDWYFELSNRFEIFVRLYHASSPLPNAVSSRTGRSAIRSLANCILIQFLLLWGSCLLKVCIVIEFALATLDFVFWHNQIFISFHWITLFFINRNPTGEETNLYRYIGWLFWHSRKKRYHSMIDWVHAWFDKFWQNKELYANCTVHIQSQFIHTLRIWDKCAYASLF